MHKKRKSRYTQEYDATNANARLSRPVFNPLFGNNSARFIEAAGVTLIAICQGSFITRARDTSVPRENASVCLFIANGNIFHSQLRHCYDVRRVRATNYRRASNYRRQKANPYFNRHAIKVYWTTRDTIYRIGAFRARVYINSDIPRLHRAVTRIVTSSSEIQTQQNFFLLKLYI